MTPLQAQCTVLGFLVLCLLFWVFMVVVDKEPTKLDEFLDEHAKQQLAVSIQQLESELLSIDFYTWLDALALVIDYQITGNAPTIWPGITRNPNTESSQLAAKIVQYFDIHNHLPMIDYGTSYGILFIPSYHELSSSRWKCQCGQPLGVKEIGSKEPIPGYQEHLDELKGVI